MQMICTSLQTDNDASTSELIFCTPNGLRFLNARLYKGKTVTTFQDTLFELDMHEFLGWAPKLWCLMFTGPKDFNPALPLLYFCHIAQTTFWQLLQVLPPECHSWLLNNNVREYTTIK